MLGIRRKIDNKSGDLPCGVTMQLPSVGGLRIQKTRKCRKIICGALIGGGDASADIHDSEKDLGYRPVTVRLRKKGGGTSLCIIISANALNSLESGDEGGTLAGRACWRQG